MLPGMEMLACPHLAVSPEAMQHIVHVESSFNPYAIGVVGGQLERQPKSLAEALATVRMLDAKGYNFSVGLAQVNRANFDRYGLDSYQKAFSVCTNLSAGAQILSGCYTSAHGDWPKAFSCYYSGNFTTGFRDGYVKKVYASINRKANEPEKVAAVPSAPVEATAPRSPPAPPRANPATTASIGLKPLTVYASSGTNYRVVLRSMAIDASAGATVSAIAAAISNASPAEVSAPSGPMPVNPIDVAADRGAPPVPGRMDTSNAPNLATIGPAPIASSGRSSNDAVFVPKVRGPDDLPDISTSLESIPSMTQAELSTIGADRADLRQEQRDAAFVF